MDLLRRAGGIPAYLIGQLLIISDVEPGVSAIGCSGLENPVNLLDKRLRDSFFRTIDDELYATEVVGCLDYIIDIDTFVSNAYRICLEDKPGLFMSQSAPFYMIRVIGEVYLGTVIYSAADLAFLLFNKGLAFNLPFRGNGASAGILHVFPTSIAPSIFPEAHQFLTVRSESSCS